MGIRQGVWVELWVWLPPQGEGWRGDSEASSPNMGSVDRRRKGRLSKRKVSRAER